MIEIVGEDLFDQIGKSDAICITTNCSISKDGLNLMGGGCAATAADRWPKISEWYGAKLKSAGHVPMIVGLEFVKFINYPNDLQHGLQHLGWYPNLDEYHHSEYTFIVMYPTMHSIMEPASLELVTRSAILLREMADTNGWTRVCLASPGTGIGGLSVDKVYPVLREILDDRFVVMQK